MKRTALARRTPMARTSAPVRETRMPQRRAKPRRSSRVVDRVHLAAVHHLPCCARDLSPCSGPLEADHAAKKIGGGRKSDDTGAIPLCQLHHSQRHSFSGPFRSWTAPVMRRWLDEQIAATRTTLLTAATNPRGAVTSSAEFSAGHLSSALEQLLPEPGAIAVGATVTLGTREGAVSAVLGDGLVAVTWLDGTTTTEALSSAVHRRA